ncbi:hypothetical protein [Spiroplasma litorale]|nr:hypothetical protein [Spiroplasma litorale]
MTAEEILLNCEKHFSFIANEIDALILYIKKLLENCKNIDNSNFYEEKIKKLIEKLIEEKESFRKNTIDRKMDKDTHVAIETYNEIQKYAERKRETLAELKFEAFALKSDIVKKEQEMILQSLNISGSENLESLEKELINSYNDDLSKVRIKNIFENKKELLINKNKNEIVLLIKQELTKQDDLNTFLKKEIISNAIELYKNDSETINLIKEEINNNLNDNSSYDKIKDTLKNFLKKAEAETIRRDNINKIIKAITEIGYTVNENNIRKIKEKNIVIIHAVKEDGKSADFAIKFDGSIIYNWEGFENHDHDEDANLFLEKLRSFDLLHSKEFKKVYREPKFIEERKNKLKTNVLKKEK